MKRLIIASVLSLSAAASFAHDREWKRETEIGDVRASVTRHDQGYHGHVRGRIDEPHSAGTVWWRFYNNPSACASTFCDSADVANPLVRAAVFYAGGYTTDHEGRTDADLPFVGFGTCRMNLDGREREQQRTPFCMEAHDDVQVELVVRSHGAIAGDMVWAIAQKTTHSGGCNPECKSILTFYFD